MKPAAFAYADPRNVPETLAILTEHGEDGKLLAGGQSLVPLMNMRLAQPDVVIDINRVPELQGLEWRDERGTRGITIRAMTRQSRVAENRDLLAALPLLDQAVRWIGHPQIRNRGTVGGSVAHADPAAELPLVFRTLDGIATARSSRGIRRIPSAEFFVYAMTPSLEPDELLTDIWLPLSSPRTGQAFLEVARRHGDFALVAVAVSLTLHTDGTISRAAIGVGGVAPTPIRASIAEAALYGRQPDSRSVREAAHLAARDTEPSTDIHADAVYRRDVAATLVERGLHEAIARAGGGQA